ncbi:MAG: hypothetical protein AAF901_02135 [Bacteroidota bacterium]
MVYGLIVIVFSWFLASRLIQRNYVLKESKAERSFIKKLFLYHIILAVAYYVYALFNPSDSIAYYNKVLINLRGENWMDFYGTSTTFIEWTGYPFIKFLGFSYEAVMALFSFFGFLGMFFFFLFFLEKKRTNVSFMGFPLLHLVFLLPNLHFWSSSFGKGSLIFLGIGMIFYSLNSLKDRFALAILGGLLVYHVRPHIMMVILIAVIIAYTFSWKNLNIATRFVVLLLAGIALYFVYQDVLSLVGIEQELLLTDSFNLTHRASELSKATSGVDITNYSLPVQLFTFLYRPLFFDAPGVLGLIVSFENVFLLMLTLYFIYKGGLKFLLTGDFLVKTAFLSFLTTSIALAQIAGNLGLAIRQKSQVMLLFLFVIMRYLDEKNVQRITYNWLKFKSRQRLSPKSR